MTKNLFAIVLLAVLAYAVPRLEPRALAGDAVLTTDIAVEAGKTYPQGGLTDLLGPGLTYRVRLFGGARFPRIQWLGGVGLGLDFTYSDVSIRSGEAGSYYRKYLWDWLFLPLTLGDILTINPGLAWLVTDVSLPSQGVDVTSIRPAGVLTVGLRYPIVPHLYVRGDGRIEKAFADHVRTASGTPLNVTGTFYSWFGGLEFSF